MRSVYEIQRIHDLLSWAIGHGLDVGSGQSGCRAWRDALCWCLRHESQLEIFVETFEEELRAWETQEAAKHERVM